MDTILPADAVEFCPHPSYQTLLACGTYKIETPENPDAVQVVPDSVTGFDTTRKQNRRGTCLILEVDSENSEHQQLQEIPLPAVLDLKWCHRAAAMPPVMAVADSEGRISLQEWSAEHRQMHCIESISTATSDVLCLSLDWSSRRFPTSNLSPLIVSLSNGSLCLLRPIHSGLLITNIWLAHDYEPWIAAWNYWDTDVIYSGGDDLKLKGWDIRQGFTQPTFINARFEGGVTSIQTHPHVEHCIAVGSYDNTVRLFDTRKPEIPLTRVEVGGGAWRVKWHPAADRKHDLLVACMHDGFKVIKFDTEKFMTASANEGRVVAHFSAHNSLAYGADWSFADDGNSGQTLIASCSFYDHVLHLWYG